MRRQTITLATMLLSTLLIVGCKQQPYQAVVDHYSELGDNERLQAANYLIDNIAYRHTLIYEFRNDSGVVTTLSPDSVNTLEDLKKYYDAEGAWIELDTILRDRQTVTDSMLIVQIDSAFKIWRESPWASHLTIDQFCEYLLPYRLTTEPLSNWREEAKKDYRWATEEPFNSYSSIAICDTLYQHLLTNNFTFAPKYTYGKNRRTYSRMMKECGGDCFDAAFHIAFVGRSLGIPIAVDYMPIWGNANGTHCINSVLMPNGESKIFMEQKIGNLDYKPYYRISKMCRISYQRNDKVDIPPKELKGIVPNYLYKSNYKDVTAEYSDTASVIMTLPDSTIGAFITGYQDEKWQPVAYSSKGKDGEVCFNSMGINNLYRITIYDGDKITSYGLPFILKEGGERAAIEPDLSNRESVTLSFSHRDDSFWPDYKTRFGIQPDREYTLSYLLGDSWEEIGKMQERGDRTLTFTDVPKGALLRLDEESPEYPNRVFTYKDKAQIWW